MHLNGFVDVISKAFLDVVIQPGQQPDELEALHSMLDHFTPDDPQKYIITAEREICLRRWQKADCEGIRSGSRSK